ncbi:MAG: hypothetical protein KBC26_02720 [Candidatus Pacebacteria bacterium]|nr:hypothetical protein [Candidatus Paceibacterota bacterium]
MPCPSNEQVFTLLAALAANTDWSQLSIEQVQVGIVNPKQTGREFSLFIRGGFRVSESGYFFRQLEPLSIPIPALPRPILADLKVKFSWNRGIESDTSPVDALTLILGTVLRSEEEFVNGFEYERRRSPLAGQMLGYQHLMWLVDHQNEFPAIMGLRGKICIDGPGLIVFGKGGHRYYPYLDQSDKGWHLYWQKVNNCLGRNRRLAVSGK